MWTFDILLKMSNMLIYIKTLFPWIDSINIYLFRIQLIGFILGLPFSFLYSLKNAKPTLKTIVSLPFDTSCSSMNFLLWMCLAYVILTFIFQISIVLIVIWQKKQIYMFGHVMPYLHDSIHLKTSHIQGNNRYRP